MNNYIMEKYNPKDLEDELMDELVDIEYQKQVEYYDPLPSYSKTYIKNSLLQEEPDSQSTHRYLVRIDKKIIGTGRWRENKGLSNIDRTSTYIYILPEFRKKGIGKDLLRLMMKDIPKHIKIIYCVVKNENNTKTAIDTLFNRYNGHLGFTNILNGSEIDEFDPKEVYQKANELKNQAVENGFDIIFVKGKPYDAEIINIDEFVNIKKTLWNDMPQEDLNTEDEDIDEDEMKEHYEYLESLNFKILSFYAIDRKTRKLAGLTEVWINKFRANIAEQDDTGVLKQYRGNRLGLTLKYQMLLHLLSDEDIKWWITGNANSNEHMLRINRILRYKPIYFEKIWEFEVDKLSKLLN